MQWIRIRFRLLGNMHVGERKWGYVRSGRSYLPGWTLWGALTNFFKRNKRCPGTFTEIGDLLNQKFWIGHLALGTRVIHESMNHWTSFLPVRTGGGGAVFQWTLFKDGSLVPLPSDAFIPQPMVYRHGVVRRTRAETGTLGNLFLTETLAGSGQTPFYLTGWVGASGDNQLPLRSGDTLQIGGNRTSSGAVILFDCSEDLPVGPDLFSGLSHLYYPGEKAPPGVLERIVLRRTRENSGKGFGGDIHDWGLHLKPGWEVYTEGVKVRPVFYGMEGWRHGTVELI